MHPLTGHLYISSVKTDDRGRAGECAVLSFEAFVEGAAPKKLSEAIDSPAIEWFRKLQGGNAALHSEVVNPDENEQ